MKYITDNEIAVHSAEEAFNLAKTLLNNGYVTMISREENLFIVNYIWSPPDADRNGVCFLDKEIIEEEIFKSE